ncbi:acyltransferase family protein [Nocardiopsis alborubida]|uniref:Acyltransferase n=1 Tax=Nocardiopsis alborubida TaxID=146802 RepID=A0A7X6MLL8_9ACTN|nr:acyltransferase [Nocardiopsis alborubida]NKZ01969.1 acyltransferase [Nocardiopsis alborubida]
MRSHYIDGLRNLGILFLFPYHAARVFDASTEFYVQGTANAAATTLVHLSYWFMPLLFLLAGMSALHALQRRSAQHYAKERVLRLLVPFLFGVLVIVPPQAYYAMRFHSGYGESFPEFLARYFTHFSDWSEYGGGISPAHLWFLAFLFVISVALLPLMLPMVAKDRSPRWMRGSLLVFVPFTALVLLSLTPDVGGKNIFVYAGYFLLGFLIAMDASIVDAIVRRRGPYLVAALAGAAGTLLDLHLIEGLEETASDALGTLVCWVTLLAMLGYGKKYLDGRTQVMAYLTPAAFPLYVFHQTFLVVVAYHIVGFADQGFGPFVLICLLSFALSIVAYEAVRRVAPARVLLGLK